MKIVTLLLSILYVGTTQAQITVQNNLTPEEIVQNILLGQGVTVSNITWNNSPASAGTVQTNLGEFGGNAAIGIQTGVVLSTGNINEILGPNTTAGSSDNTGVENYQNDADLNAISGVQMFDQAILEFDFVPSGDTISFHYVFASEEYPEFVNAGFNDAFGFFLTGPNPNGGTYNSQNIALIPGTSTVVSIDNVNSGLNSQYYIDNSGGTNIEFDGYTVPIEAIATVECGEVYHIKLGIGDAADQAFNSAVFLESSSFSSNGIQISITAETGDTILYEGCTDASISFVRDSNQINDSLIINYEISGTAVNGVDYSQLDTIIAFAPGEDSVSFTLDPINDGLTEGSETVIFTIYTISPCGDTITSTDTLWIVDPYAEITVQDLELPCPKEDSAWLVVDQVSGYAPFSYEWSNGDIGDSSYVSTSSAGIHNYTVTVTDACGAQAQDTATLTIGTFDVAEFIATPQAGQAPLHVDFTNTTSISGLANYNWTFGNGLTDNTFTPSNVSTLYTDEGQYLVMLEVIDSSGCVDTATIYIEVYDFPEVTMPNVFTPGSDGNNDLFKVIQAKSVDSFECFIVNRWGNNVFVINDILEGWDGRTTEGVDAKDGVYFYTYTAISKSEKEISGSGFFQLIREN